MQASTVDSVVTEADIYRQLLEVKTGPRSGLEEDLRTTPLMTLSVKDAVDRDLENRRSTGHSWSSNILNQYAVLGFHTGENMKIADHEPILMNVNAPNSTFICGSQGSGKSYTLSCMLENCLLADERIGRLHQPLAGLSFHYDSDSAGTVAESAYLCSMGIRVSVLVSQSNEHALRSAYEKIPDAKRFLSVSPLLFQPSDLSIEHMHRLMAFSEKDSSMPLYMAVARRVLRRMAIDAQGGPFDYEKFKKALDSENLSRDQRTPMDMRLDLLESFLDLSKRGSKRRSSLLDVACGTLTIVDLTDPFMDPATACVLFEICLSLFKEKKPTSGVVVVLDEAHKYMTSSSAASNFANRLLTTIREQRHNATRVIIATQEPTISEKLLDLCTVSIVHRFASPAWFACIQNHLSGATKAGHSVSGQYEIFRRIMDLQVGESLVFAPSSFLCIGQEGRVSKLGGVAITMKTRTRLGMDGGMSVLSYPIPALLSQESSSSCIANLAIDNTCDGASPSCANSGMPFEDESGIQPHSMLQRSTHNSLSPPQSSTVLDVETLIDHALIEATHEVLAENPRGCDFGTVGRRAEQNLRSRSHSLGVSEDEARRARNKRVIKWAVEEWMERTDSSPPGGATWLSKYFPRGSSATEILCNPSAQVWRTKGELTWPRLANNP